MTFSRANFTQSIEAHLDHRVSLNVVFETLELKMQHRREGLEYDTLPRVLQAITFRLVLIVALQRLDNHVILERLVQVRHALDIQLYVCCEQ